MGTYHVFANLTKRVYLEPNDVVPGTAKKRQIIAEPEVTSLLAWAMLGPWRGDHVVAMIDDLVVFEWPNVTAELMAQMKSDGA